LNAFLDEVLGKHLHLAIRRFLKILVVGQVRWPVREAIEKLLKEKGEFEAPQDIPPDLDPSAKKSGFGPLPPADNPIKSFIVGAINDLRSILPVLLNGMDCSIFQDKNISEGFSDRDYLEPDTRIDTPQVREELFSLEPKEVSQEIFLNGG